MAKPENLKRKFIRFGLTLLAAISLGVLCIDKIDQTSFNFKGETEQATNLRFRFTGVGIQFNHFGTYLSLREHCPENLAKSQGCDVQIRTERIAAFKPDGPTDSLQILKLGDPEGLTSW